MTRYTWTWVIRSAHSLGSCATPNPITADSDSTLNPLRVVSTSHSESTPSQGSKALRLSAFDDRAVDRAPRATEREGWGWPGIKTSPTFSAGPRLSLACNGCVR
jgi:hypothetical protein